MEQVLRKRIKVVFRTRPHPCKIKGCSLKSKNGRCSLAKNTFGMTSGVVDYSICFDDTTRGEISEKR